MHDSCARITKSIDPEVFSSYYRNSHGISWAKYRESWLTKNRFENGSLRMSQIDRRFSAKKNYFFHRHHHSNDY